MSSRRPWVGDRRIALWGGVAAFTAGALLLYDAHERRGIDRPFWLRFLPS